MKYSRLGDTIYCGSDIVMYCYDGIAAENAVTELNAGCEEWDVALRWGTWDM